MADTAAPKLERLGLDVLSAYLIAAGLELFGQLNRSVFLDVTAALYALDDARGSSVHRERGKAGSEKRLGPKAPENDRLHKAIVRELSNLKNQKLSEMAKMRRILPLLYKSTPRPSWRTAEALVKFAKLRGVRF